MNSNRLRKIITVASSVVLSFTVHAQNKGPQWLENAVFYQIYPSSYMDSDGNGYGECAMVESHLSLWLVRWRV